MIRSAADAVLSYLPIRRMRVLTVSIGVTDDSGNIRSISFSSGKTTRRFIE